MRKKKETKLEELERRLIALENKSPIIANISLATQLQKMCVCGHFQAATSGMWYCPVHGNMTSGVYKQYVIS